MKKAVFPLSTVFLTACASNQAVIERSLAQLEPHKAASGFTVANLGWLLLFLLVAIFALHNIYKTLNKDFQKKLRRQAKITKTSRRRRTSHPPASLPYPLPRPGSADQDEMAYFSDSIPPMSSDQR